MLLNGELLIWEVQCDISIQTLLLTVNKLESMLSHDRVMIDRVLVGYWIYWTLSQLLTALYTSLSLTC
jgi:hypothetical protein